MPLNGVDLDPIIDRAAHQATKAAKAARAVFTPPVATFVGSRTRERELGNGPVLTVEADQAPALTVRSKLHLLHQRHGSGDYPWEVARAPARSSEEGPSRFHIDHRCGSRRP